MTALQAKRAAARLVKSDGIGALTKSSVCRYLGIPEGSLMYRTGLRFHEIVDYVKQNVALRGSVPANQRVYPTIRKAAIVNAVTDWAKLRGLSNLTINIAAKQATCSTGTIAHHFGSIDGLRDAVILHALDYKIRPIIRDGVRMRHPRLRGYGEGAK